MILALYFAGGFFLMIGITVFAYFIHARMRKNISLSEFRSRLKKLLE